MQTDLSPNDFVEVSSPSEGANRSADPTPGGSHEVDPTVSESEGASFSQQDDVPVAPSPKGEGPKYLEASLHARYASEALHTAHNYVSICATINHPDAKMTAEIWSSRRLHDAIEHMQNCAGILGYDIVKRKPPSGAASAPVAQFNNELNEVEQ